MGLGIFLSNAKVEHPRLQKETVFPRSPRIQFRYASWHLVPLRYKSPGSFRDEHHKSLYRGILF